MTHQADKILNIEKKRSKSKDIFSNKHFNLEKSQASTGIYLLLILWHAHWI